MSQFTMIYDFMSIVVLLNIDLADLPLLSCSSIFVTLLA